MSECSTADMNSLNLRRRLSLTCLNPHEAVKTSSVFILLLTTRQETNAGGARGKTLTNMILMKCYIDKIMFSGNAAEIFYLETLWYHNLLHWTFQSVQYSLEHYYYQVSMRQLDFSSDGPRTELGGRSSGVGVFVCVVSERGINMDAKRKMSVSQRV